MREVNEQILAYDLLEPARREPSLVALQEAHGCLVEPENALLLSVEPEPPLPLSDDPPQVARALLSVELEKDDGPLADREEALAEPAQNVQKRREVNFGVEGTSLLLLALGRHALRSQRAAQQREKKNFGC